MSRGRRWRIGTPSQIRSPPLRTPILALPCCLAVVVSTSAVSLLAHENNQPPSGFRALFNGKDLQGWYGSRLNPVKLWEMDEQEQAKFREASLAELRKHWRVEDGEIVNDGHGDYLTTVEEFGDYELWVDYKTVAKADSGIYLRGTPQVQIWDYTKEGGKWDRGADKGSGGLFNNAKTSPGRDPLVLADKSFGEWNRFRIRQVGARTSVWLNDKLVVDHATMENYWDRKRSLFPRGPIQLQTHGGEIRWRNIFIREIEPDEANDLLARQGNQGFESVFNGKDLSGWIGAVDNYEVVDGAIRCKKGKGGNLFTKKVYGDFVVRLEMRLPPKGNNGLAIRYPGKGNPAYAGMTELQVLDTQYPGKLDDRQYHGSAYGIVAAQKGYLRPAGQWNFQEVTVQGSRIKVELNGTVILDADLAEVSEYMHNSAHPGKMLEEGHFGFAGHNDPVVFRNIQIKTLD